MSTIYDKDPLASIEQLYKDCLSRFPKDMPEQLAKGGLIEKKYS